MSAGSTATWRLKRGTGRGGCGATPKGRSGRSWGKEFSIAERAVPPSNLEVEPSDHAATGFSRAARNLQKGVGRIDMFAQLSLNDRQVRLLIYCRHRVRNEVAVLRQLCRWIPPALCEISAAVLLAAMIRNVTTCVLAERFGRACDFQQPKSAVNASRPKWICYAVRSVNMPRVRAR